MRVLIACEFSGVVRRAFRARGHDVMSCDLLPADDGEYEEHYEGDIFRLLGDTKYRWDLLIAHPPCTYLCNSGVKWLYKDGKEENGRDEARWKEMRDGVAFYNELWNAPIEMICLENPIMHGHATELLTPGMPEPQYIQPWQFGHKEMKATGLRLKNLPRLVPTNVVGPPPKDIVERRKWAKVHMASPGKDRWRERSRTLEGIADAFADQWSGNLAARVAAE